MSAPSLKEELDRIIEHEDFGRLIEAVLLKNQRNVFYFTRKLVGAGIEEPKIWMAILEIDRRRKKEKLDESRFKL